MELALPEGHFLFTSESVNEGHPDKLSDQVSDAILDACIAADPKSRVACESCCKGNMVMIFGEITTSAQINYEQVVREAVRQIGYDSIEKGLDYKSFDFINKIETQSQEIAHAVIEEKTEETQGAGDQGIMFGYATNETKCMMPLTHDLATSLGHKLTEVRKNGALSWLRPDGKTQVTVEYKQEGAKIVPLRVNNIVISTQHEPGIANEEIRRQIIEYVIKPVVPTEFLDANTIYHINPSGSFTLGGPAADAGLTGRKIIIDTYGGWGAHGGGAFSGKDPSKVDRSAAYACRWIAKSLVAAGLCDRALVQVGYAIGISKPLSIYVNSYGTVKNGKSDFDLCNIVQKNFDLRPGIIVRDLKLKRPIYKQLAAYGHMGREEIPDCLWEIPKDLSHEK